MQKDLDVQSEELLSVLGESEEIRGNRIPGVRTVLVVLSSAGLVYDIESLRQKITHVYGDARVYFQNTLGKPVGESAPETVDLLIDFTGPGQRQPWLAAKKWRRKARVAVGRSAGWFRRRIYDRVYADEGGTGGTGRAGGDPTGDPLMRERRVQREVLKLVGVALVPTGDTHPDLGKSIALQFQ